MIDLTPIDKRIQKKLFQKMHLLNRGTPGETVGGLTHNQLSVRSPFVRMTSDSKNPVILMGGELIKNFALALVFGVIVGTYSSIYIASNALIMMGLTKDHLKVEEAENPDNYDLP